MLVAEEYGGGTVSGQGLLDLAIIAEERGRVLQPGPFVSMNIVAAALATTGSTEQRVSVLPALCRGERLATWVTGATTGDGPSPYIAATSTDHGFCLSGRSSLVQDGSLADLFLVTAGNPDSPSQFLVGATTPGITARPRKAHDITQRLASVSFDHVEVPLTSLVGEPGRAGADIERQIQLACVLTTAETVGAMDVLFDLTCQYAKDRTAFGRPIGSFQAVKHQLADLSLSLECAKAIAAAAAAAVQADQEDAGEIVSMAKSWVGDTGIEIAQGCFQVFGGIGYTWEHDLHLFLRRVTMNSLLFGQSDWHRERLCRIHGI
jgi:alkylation response protein AidB-like acyl-CoA dehydrogenase